MIEIVKNDFNERFKEEVFNLINEYFIKNFYDDFNKVIIIGNPKVFEEPEFKIDSIIFLNKKIFLLKFFEYYGKIIIPKSGDIKNKFWLTDYGNFYFGRKYKNPYEELYELKNKFIDLYNNYIFEKIENDLKIEEKNIKMIFYIYGDAEIIGEKENLENSNFFIITKDNYKKKFVELFQSNNENKSFNKNFLDIFKKYFICSKIFNREKNIYVDFETFYRSSKDVLIKENYLNYEILTDGQKTCLKLLEDFLKDKEKNIFLISGASNTGKSFLIPYIQDMANRLNFEIIEFLAFSKRVAHTYNYEFNELNIEFKSIYSYIYDLNDIEIHEDNEIIESKKNNKNKEENEELDGDKNEEKNKKEDEEKLNEKVSEEEEIFLEKICLKKLDSENFLFIVDDSHLVNDNYFEIFNIVYGSGFLLKDFLFYTGLITNESLENKKSNKIKGKIILIGNNYLINLAGDKNLANSKYLKEKYFLDVVEYKLLNMVEYSEINIILENIRKKIENKCFNELIFRENKSLVLVRNNDEKLTLINDFVNKKKFPILVYTNKLANDINYFIKNKILENGQKFNSGDLIVFNKKVITYNLNDPYEKVFIENGEYGEILELTDEFFIERIRLKGRNKEYEFEFRKAIIRLLFNNKIIKIFIINKNDLEEDELFAIKIIINKVLKEELKENFYNSQNYLDLVNSEEYKILEESLNKKQILFEKENDENKKNKLEKEIKEIKKNLNRLEKECKKRFAKKEMIYINNNPESKYSKIKNSAVISLGWAITVHKAIYHKWDEVIFDVDTGGLLEKTNETYFRWIYSALTRAKDKIVLFNYTPLTPFTYCNFNDNINPVKRLEFLYLGDKNSDFINDFYKFINDKLRGTTIEILKIEHYNFLERYIFFEKIKNTKTVLNFFYNSDAKFRYPSFLKGDENLFNEILKLLEKKDYMFDSKKIENENHRELYEKLDKYFINNGFFIKNLEQYNYRDILCLYKDDDELEVEMIYNKNYMFTNINLLYCTKIELWNTFKEMIKNFGIN